MGEDRGERLGGVREPLLEVGFLAVVGDWGGEVVPRYLCIHPNVVV